MKKSKFLAICVAIVLTLSAFLLVGMTPQNMTTVQASTAQGRLFANRYVMDDLREATLECGRPFDERDFAFDSRNTRVHMLHFVEYAFTFHARHRANFALFVYLWNPSRLDIVPNSSQNTIQMATRYNANGQPDLYSKLPLRFLSRSTGNVEGLFYKFEIVLEGEHRASLLARLSANIDNRRYDFSGVELTLRPTFRVTDFHIGRTYLVSGFARGHGELPNTPSTLTMRVDELRTISLDVRHTWFRTEVNRIGTGNEFGTGFQHQINTVYFSIPNYILEHYGRLQRIMAEWWEYQTQPIYVTSRRSLYDRFRPIVGQRTVRNSALRYGIYRNFAGGGSTSLHAQWGFNDLGNFIRPSGHGAGTLERYIYYMFHVNNIERYHATQLPIGAISSEQLTNWIMNYNASFKRGYLPVAGDRRISADLFTNTIDADRLAQGIVRGHNIQEINADDIQDLMWYDNVRRTTFWERFWSGGQQFVFGEKMQAGLKPIEALPSVFPTGTNVQLSQQLFVRLQDIPALRTFHQQATARDETVFMFRFAVTDYRSAWLTIYNDLDTAWWEYIFGWIVQQQRRYEGQLYKAQQTIFLDFDIISLTFFNDDIGYIVIPVVSDPIDIIPDVTPPPFDPPPQYDWTWWITLILGLLLLILLLVLLSPFLPFIAMLLAFVIKAVIQIFLFPFHLLMHLTRQKRKRKKGGDPP